VPSIQQALEIKQESQSLPSCEPPSHHCTYLLIFIESIDVSPCSVLTPAHACTPLRRAKSAKECQMRAALTDIVVQKAKAGTEIWDASLPAFGLRVGKHRKTWVLKKGSGRVAIGHYPALSLAEARRKAHAHLDTHHQPEATQLPFPDALEAFTRLYLPTIAQSTAKEWERLLRKHFSNLGDIQKLTARDVYRITETLKPSEANHAIVALRRMLNWARQTGRIQNRIELTKPNKEKSRSRVLSLDELAQVWKATEQPTTFNVIVRLLILTAQRRGEIANIHLCSLTSAPDAKSLNQYLISGKTALKNTDTQGDANNASANTTHSLQKIGKHTIHNIRNNISHNQKISSNLQHDTKQGGQSNQEILPSFPAASVETPIAKHTITTTPSHYQSHGTVQHTTKDITTLNYCTWHAHQTKNRKEHTIPLSDFSRQHIQKLIGTLPTHSKPFNTWSKPKTALDKLSGVTNWTLHDLRRTAATHMAEQLRVRSVQGGSLSGTASTGKTSDRRLKK